MSIADRSTPRAPGSPRRLFRFFQWNDMHLRARADASAPARSPNYHHAEALGRWAAECAAGSRRIAKPDLVVSVGDLIDGETDALDQDFATLQASLVDGLAVPFLPCVGNHENAQGEGVPAQNRAYDAAFGADRHNYVCTFGGVAFVVVDNSGGHRTADAITGARNAWVRDALAAHAHLPTIVVCHIPLVPMRDPAALAPSFGFSSWCTVDTGMLDAVEAHRASVIAVLSGHLHITGVIERAGIAHVCVGGTAGYPPGFAAYDVHEDRIEARVHSAPHVWHDPRNNIHGCARHGRDYVDAQHPTPRSYVAGRACERRFTIRLAAGKRPDPAAPKAAGFSPPGAG